MSDLGDYLGFDWQRSSLGDCSRFAVRHALLCLGVPMTNGELTDAMGSRFLLPFTGAGEEAVMAGVRSGGCVPTELRARTATEMRRGMDDLLEQGAPCIVCTGDWGHWAVIAGRSSRGRYLWIDSNDEDLIGEWAWADVAEWMACDGEERPYYAIGVRPRRPAGLEQSLVPRFEKVWACLADADLCAYWGTYLAVLYDIFDPGRRGDLGASTFFDRNSTAILNAANAEAETTDTGFKYELTNLRIVATMHDMRMPASKEARAAVRLGLELFDL